MTNNPEVPNSSGFQVKQKDPEQAESSDEDDDDDDDKNSGKCKTIRNEQGEDVLPCDTRSEEINKSQLNQSNCDLAFISRNKNDFTTGHFDSMLFCCPLYSCNKNVETYPTNRLYLPKSCDLPSNEEEENPEFCCNEILLPPKNVNTKRNYNFFQWILKKNFFRKNTKRTPSALFVVCSKDTIRMSNKNTYNEKEICCCPSLKTDDCGKTYLLACKKNSPPQKKPKTLMVICSKYKMDESNNKTCNPKEVCRCPPENQKPNKKYLIVNNNNKSKQAVDCDETYLVCSKDKIMKARVSKTPPCECQSTTKKCIVTCDKNSEKSTPCLKIVSTNDTISVSRCRICKKEAPNCRCPKTTHLNAKKVMIVKSRKDLKHPLLVVNSKGNITMFKAKNGNCGQTSKGKGLKFLPCYDSDCTLTTALKRMMCCVVPTANDDDQMCNCSECC